MTLFHPPGIERRVDRVGLIGDSWVAGNRFDPFLREACSEIGLQADISSAGIKGADSRRVREELFRTQPDTNTSAGLLSDPAIGTVIVFAGVNDLLEHRGAGYYAHNTMMIVRESARSGIMPFVVEIPRFGLSVEPRLTRTEYFKRYCRRWLMEAHSDDQIGRYRQKFRDCLKEELLKNKEESLKSVVLIDPDPVIPDYQISTAFFSNPYHLNDEGNRRLARLIAQILRDSFPVPVKGSSHD